MNSNDLLLYQQQQAQAAAAQNQPLGASPYTPTSQGTGFVSPSKEAMMIEQGTPTSGLYRYSYGPYGVGSYGTEQGDAEHGYASPSIPRSYDTVRTRPQP